ncbi:MULTISPECIES: peptide chain release factor 1 [unclassified Aurantimonas]|uniref:peptide chain release factor 1 n=1 Tax=unclassified Aurantimonas TaxID=2638230 RepID=UPI0016529492|nr:peptide chain release factor 1 [Aurantimonas sp. DM33-3]MBC6717104.1 peptide chain release factor 1 [Aurantimonas sp. DM33-3]MCW7542792.1 peptide chain release factor 1 [Aurantimonas litoralis]
MATLPKSSLDEILNRFALLEHEMSKGPEHEVYTKLAAEYSGLEEVVAAIRTYQKAEQELAEARAILDEPAAGRDMRELAEIEIDELKERLETLTAEIRILLLPKDAADEKGAILEIRAGTGGSEAGLFAGDLFRMYQRYAEMNRWKVEIISASEGEVGGYREVIAAIRGVGVFSRLKFESGVHRVQRVPETESGGRIHTSAATVAVLPEAEDIDVEVKTEDIRIDTMRASGAGGQHVNTTDSAVRITHIPTGIVVTSSEKSQHQNRARAMQVLKARLFDMERQRADDERSAARKSQVGSGDRSERIRTYNFPQGRVTDHRINLTLYKLDRVIEGEMDELVDALVADHQAHLLAAVGVDA